MTIIQRRIDGWRKKAYYGALIACAMVGSGFPSTAWTADLSSLAPAKPMMVVAAGVGYENAETATITVKTYDAENGVILSDETYDLNVREDSASAGEQPRERILRAGSVLVLMDFQRSGFASMTRPQASFSGKAF